MRPNIPKLVYEFARNRNLEGLRQLQESGACLTQFHHAFHPWFNAIAKLAFDGYGDAAEFLVDHQMGHVNHLVLGYAHAGNVERTQYWVKNGGSVTPCITGLAYAGNKIEVEKLLKQCHQTLSLHFSAIQGYAKGGHHDLVDAHLNTTFPATHPFHLAAISQAVVGYAMSGDRRGLAMAEKHNINLTNYYTNLSINTRMHEIPEEYRTALVRRAAFLGQDDYITNRLLELSDDDKHSILLNYYHGGHQPLDGLGSLTPQEIISSLATNNHLTMIERHLSQAIDGLDLRNGNSRNSHTDTPEYHSLSVLLSINKKARTRELLYINDDTKRKQLHLMHGLKMNPDIGKSYLFLAKLNRVNRWIRSPIQSFECAWMLSHKANFNTVVDFILLTKQANTLALTIDIVNEIILAKLLNTTPSNAQKIHSHFSTMFTSVINKNKQETLPSPILTRKGSH